MPRIIKEYRNESKKIWMGSRLADPGGFLNHYTTIYSQKSFTKISQQFINNLVFSGIWCRISKHYDLFSGSGEILIFF